MKKLYWIALIFLLTVAMVSPSMAGQTSSGGSCKVDVRSKPVALIANHLFIVYTNATGSYYYRGGPSKDGTSGWGTIVTDSGRYLPGTIDYVRSAPSVTAADSAASCVGGCFDSTSSRIEAGNTAYGILTPNSNSVIRTLLHTCSIREVKPNVWAPGWQTVIPLP
ncbi:MAG: hypothetical protein WCB46_07705 [Methanoregula sp.]